MNQRKILFIYLSACVIGSNICILLDRPLHAIYALLLCISLLIFSIAVILVGNNERI